MLIKLAGEDRARVDKLFQARAGKLHKVVAKQRYRLHDDGYPGATISPNKAPKPRGGQ